MSYRITFRSLFSPDLKPGDRGSQEQKNSKTMTDTGTNWRRGKFTMGFYRGQKETNPIEVSEGNRENRITTIIVEWHRLSREHEKDEIIKGFWRTGRQFFRGIKCVKPRWGNSTGNQRTTVGLIVSPPYPEF